jgi:hypothetical protein
MLFRKKHWQNLLLTKAVAKLYFLEKTKNTFKFNFIFLIYKVDLKIEFKINFNIKILN